MSQTRTRTPLRKAMRTATVLTGLGGLAGAGLAAAGPAEAGTNGQHVYFYDPGSSHVQICGHNQNGTHVCTSWHYVSVRPAYVYNFWWWKGEIWIYGYNRSAQTTCNVPTYYSSSSYYCGTL